APAWLRRTLVHPDDALAHAAVLAMRRSANWADVLALLDGPDAGPTRALALRALADRAEPAVVDGLIARLASEPDSGRRRQYAALLARVYKTPGPWAYWGYRPAPRPANTVAWGRTEAIAESLDRALDDADDGVRLAVIRRMIREKVPTRLATLQRRLGARPGSEEVAAIIESLRDHAADERPDLLARIVADRSQASANRLAAVPLCRGGREEARRGERLGLIAASDDGPVPAAAIRHVGKPSLPGAAPRILRALGSPDADVRAAAVEVAAILGVSDASERLQEL